MLCASSSIGFPRRMRKWVWQRVEGSGMAAKVTGRRHLQADFSSNPGAERHQTSPRPELDQGLGKRLAGKVQSHHLKLHLHQEAEV